MFLWNNKNLNIVKKFKLLFSLIVLLTASVQLNAQMVIPIGENCTGEDIIPVNNYYNYSYSQTIYSADELVAGEITSISYKFDDNETTNIVSQIYLGEVSRGVFANSGDFVPADSLTQVFSGDVTFNNGWVTINFTNTFDYSGEGNLVVAYLNNTGSWTNQRMFTVCSSTESKSIICYRNEEISMDSPNSVSSSMRMVLNSRPSVKFVVNPIAASCNPPFSITIQETTSNTATITWPAVEGVEQYAVAYKETNEQIWIDTILTNTNSVLIPLLESNVSYDLKLWSICSDENSVALNTSFTTLPPAEQISSLPFVCNFNDSEEANLWTIQNGNQTNKWFYGTITNSDLNGSIPGSGSMYISNNQGTTNSYDNTIASNVYFSRFIQFDNSAEFKLTFDWKCIAEGNSDYLKVFLLPTTYELSNHIIPTTGEITDRLSGSNAWTREEVVLSNEYANGAYNLVFFWRNDNSVGTNPPAAVDNISIEAVPCARINDVFVNLTEDEGNMGATVSYINNNVGENISYIIEYKLQASDTWTSLQTNENSILLNDLEHTSTYAVRVKVLCSETEESEYSEIVYFTTPCGVVSEFPWTENFEQDFLLETNQIGSEYAPQCWENINECSPYYQWEQTESESSEGNRCLSFYGYQTSGTYSDWLITPLINFDGGQRLTFKIKRNDLTKQPKFKVYYYEASETDITSINDTSLFVLLDTVVCTQNTTEFKKMEVNLSDIADLARIAIVVNEPTCEFYLDEFTIDNAPLCPEVFGLDVNILTTSSISVNFDTSNSVGAGWTIAYSQADSIEAFVPDSATHVIVNPNDVLPIVINNLNTGIYYVAVKSNCEGEYSEVERVEIPIAQILPYAINFNDSLAYGWEFMNNETNKWCVGAAVDCGTEGGQSMYISENNGTTNTYDNGVNAISYAMTNIVFGDYPAFNITFNWRANGEGNYDYGKVYLLPLDYELNQYSLPNDSYSLTGRLNVHSDWQTENIFLNSEYANGIYKLIFAWKNDGSGGQNPPLAVDNIMITSLTCAPVETLSLSTFDNGSSDISVVYTDANETNITYQIEYQAENDTAWTVVTTDQTSYVISNLLYETNYTVKVAVVCDNGAITNYVEETITTPCGVISSFPWIEQFEENLSSCWYQMIGDMSDSVTYASSLNTSGANGWKYSAYNTVNGVGGGRLYADLSYIYAKYWVVSPSFDLGNGDTIYQLSADIFRRAVNNDALAGAPNGDRFAILVSTDDGASWVTANALIFGSGESVYDYDISVFGLEASNIKFKLVDANNQPFTGNVRIAFFGEGTTEKMLIDNLQISEWEVCQIPSMVNVTNITANSAELTFMEFGQSTQWEYILTTGDEIDTTATPILINNPGTYLNDLVDNTNYTVVVRGLCSENQYSDWSEPITFSTPAQVTTLPFETSFTDDHDNQKWVSVSNTSNAWAIGSATYSTLSGSVENDKSAYMSTNGGESYGVNPQSGWNYTYAYFYREFDFENGGTNYTLSFDYKVSGQMWGNSITTGLYILIKNEEDQILASWTETDDNTPAYAGTNSWTRADIELPEMEGIKKIVFYTWGYTHSYNQQTQVPPAIDNIAIMDMTCEPPTNVVVSNITSSGAEVSWEGNAENYKINCVVEGSNDTISYTTSSTSYVLPLSSFENYLVNVQSICEEELFSLPSEIIAFSTLQDADTLPYTCGFEGLGNNGWMLRNGNCNNRWTIGVPTGRSSASLFISDDDETAHYAANTSSVVVAEKLFQFGTSEYVTISFDLTIGGEISSNIYYDYLKVFLLPATEILEPSTSANLTEDCIYATSDYAQGVILQHLGHNSICLLDSTQTITITIPTPVNEQKKLVFLWANNYMLGTQPGAIIDNISITTIGNIEQECLVPENLTVSDITATTANISWTPQGEETQWQVKLNEETPIDVTTPIYAITNLLPSTTYNISVRANCGAETSEWATTSFTTIDTLINPTVTTLQPSAITATSAILNGSVEEGSEAITDRGFYFKESISQEWETISSNEDSEFSFLKSDLQPQTTYTYKAYVTTASNTFEGEEVEFTTEQSSLSELKDELFVNLYPNPTNEKAYLEIKGLKGETKGVINDMQGRVLKTIEINSERIEIDLKEFSSGIYYIRIFNDKLIHTCKIIKEGK